MNAVCFKAIYWQLQESTVRHSHCFCVLGEQTKMIHLENRINRAGNTLLTNAHEILYPLGQRGDKPYPVQRRIPVV